MKRRIALYDVTFDKGGPLRLLAPLTLCLLLVPTFAQDRTTPAATFDQWIQRYSDEVMRFNIDAAASRRYFRLSDPRFQDRIEGQISPRTTARREENYALMRRGLEELKRFEKAPLTDAQRKSFNIIRWDLETRTEGRAFDDYEFPFVQNGPGAHTSLVQLLTVNHPLNTAKDAENYISRLRLLPARMDESIVEARRISGRGLRPPSFVLQQVVVQINGFLQIPAASSPLVTRFIEGTAAIKDLAASRRQELVTVAQQVTTNGVYPAWRRALALVEGEIPRATTDAGLWRFPNGSEAYEYALKRFTTTSMSPEEIHDLGLRMVAEIEGRMDNVLRQLGYAEGSVRARMDKMRADQPKFPDTAEGRAQYQSFIADIVKDAERRAPQLFDRLPKMPVVAKAYPEFMGARAPSYSLGATDGSRPGTYQYPVVGVPLTKFGVRTVAYHEAIPGHHFQGALQAEDTTLPRFQQDGVFGNNSAIGEGWGLYAERVVAEEGWYEGDLAGLLGQLDAEVFRARRLVVDTGLHAKRWTREQAIDYLGPNPAGSAVAEVERYVSNPGQACSYMIGELKIIELRERAKKDLGSRFSLREFHTAILGAGRVPLDILDTVITGWIKSKA
jgi:uncharacterized protein (DUF885 family)